jgi:hypothetical protein
MFSDQFMLAWTIFCLLSEGSIFIVAFNHTHHNMASLEARIVFVCCSHLCGCSAELSAHMSNDL